MAEFTQDDYTILCKAIAQGATVVQYGDKRVEYRSLKEMLQIKKMMGDDLGLNGPASADGSGGGRRYATFSKGI